MECRCKRCHCKRGHLKRATWHTTMTCAPYLREEGVVGRASKRYCWVGNHSKRLFSPLTSHPHNPIPDKGREMTAYSHIILGMHCKSQHWELFLWGKNPSHNGNQDAFFTPVAHSIIPISKPISVQGDFKTKRAISGHGIWRGLQRCKGCSWHVIDWEPCTLNTAYNAAVGTS